MASYIKDSDYKVITSKFGHDGFLLEDTQFSEIVEPILAKL